MRHLRKLAIAAMLSIPGVAFAQSYVSANAPETHTYGVEVNAGVGGWAGSIGSNTSVGPSYGATASLFPDYLVTPELGYQGYTNAIDGGGRITSNKVQLDAKVGPFLGNGGLLPFRPYGYAGVAANFIGTNANSRGYGNATEGLIPMGAGVDLLATPSVRVGARGSYDYNPGVGGDVSAITKHPDGWQAGLLAQGAF